MDFVYWDSVGYLLKEGTPHYRWNVSGILLLFGMVVLCAVAIRFSLLCQLSVFLSVCLFDFLCLYSFFFVEVCMRHCICSSVFLSISLSLSFSFSLSLFLSLLFLFSDFVLAYHISTIFVCFLISWVFLDFGSNDSGR